MKLLVCGSRTVLNYEIVEKAILPYNPTMIIHGGATGTDFLAERYAERRQIPTLVFKPDYALGKHAPLIRNRQMVDISDTVLAIWDGRSRGTMHTVNYAREKGVPCQLLELQQ